MKSSGTCQKCLTGGTGYVVGQPCITPGCDGIVEEEKNFRDLVDKLPEPMTCGRRFDMYAGTVPLHSDREPGQDHWQKIRSNGDRVCSYCGSLHPEDMFRLVKASAEAPEGAPYHSVVEIEPSDKGYKIYVNQPGVRNAMEGGIKFYTQHLPRDADGNLAVCEERQAEYSRAVKASQKRFDAYLAGIRKGRDEQSSGASRTIKSNEGTSTPMPKYRCHKEVWALKIREVVTLYENSGGLAAAILVPEESGYGPFTVTKEFVMRKSPKAGGYFVVYDDSHKSFIPAQAFEEGYTRITY